ncbi:MAG: Adenine specific DNA methylase Mod [Candidatus Alkanophagales archaeon MCA70_species_2]|nr:Adenine specific DNA methylase Mod [Candidatus Alkanophaga liquidiphilum]
MPELCDIAQEVSWMIKLEYDGKKSESEILNKPIKGYALKEIKSYGNSRLDGWKNMLIFGDNFIALKLLLKNPQIKGEVRLIYIDPPFSTNQIFKAGNNRTATISRSDEDLIAYKDTLSGAEYLEFLRERLILLKEILADNGSIYLHIDCKIGHYVKIIMDEIFGPDRFINDITRIKCNPKNFERKAYGNIKDMILFYSKTSKYVWNDPREELTEEDIKRLFPKIDSNGRRYTTTPLHAPGETKNGPTGQPWRGIKPPKGRHWRYPPEELERLDKMGLIEWSSTGNPRKKIYVDDVLAKGKKRQDVWELKDPPYPTYPTEKNLEMLKTIIEASSNPDDIVLDCFVGSGTTIVAAEKTGRRWYRL